MKTRTTITAKCGQCGRALFLRRLRGPWRGLVQIQNGALKTDAGRCPVVQLPETNGEYTLAGLCCPTCK